VVIPPVFGAVTAPGFCWCFALSFRQPYPDNYGAFFTAVPAEGLLTLQTRFGLWSFLPLSYGFFAAVACAAPICLLDGSAVFAGAAPAIAHSTRRRAGP